MVVPPFKSTLNLLFCITQRPMNVHDQHQPDQVEDQIIQNFYIYFLGFLELVSRVDTLSSIPCAESREKTWDGFVIPPQYSDIENEHQVSQWRSSEQQYSRMEGMGRDSSKHYNRILAQARYRTRQYNITGILQNRLKQYRTAVQNSKEQNNNEAGTVQTGVKQTNRHNQGQTPLKKSLFRTRVWISAMSAFVYQQTRCSRGCSTITSVSD